MNNVSNDTSLSSRKYDDLIKKYKVEKGSKFTHTRIPDRNMGAYGGLFNINYNDTFWNLYHENVFKNKNKEYLTEKQLIEDGPLLVDVDLRYETSVKSRQHTKEHIIDLIVLYASKLNEIYKIEPSQEINVYVMEKYEINLLDDKTKDGIHFVFTISMHKAEQVILRKKIINDIGQIWDNLPMTNTFDEVFDEGITKGFVNWQLFGSRKPGHKAYELSYYYTLIYDNEEDSWDLKENNVSKLNILEHLPLMSARNSNNKRFELLDNEYLLSAIEKEKLDITSKEHKKPKINMIGTNIDLEQCDFSKIVDSKQLDTLLQSFLDNLSHNEYEVKETNQFTMILPESYYEEGSFNKWIRVGWALKNTHEKLFLTWMKFSSQSSTFDFRDVETYYNMWKLFDYKNSDGLTNRSIMYWAKADNKNCYSNIRKETISYYIEQTLESILNKEKVGEFDLANVLYQMCKDQYICVSVKNNQWYEYQDKKNKWYEIDSGNTLRLKISKDMHDLYMQKADDLINLLAKMEQSGNDTDTIVSNLKVRSSKLGDICVLLKTTSWKNNIMKEARDIFYDNDFIQKVDANPYLLCFNNYVVDFKTKTYRKGRPDDYISKSTNIDYIPLNKLKGVHPFDKTITYEETINELYEFINSLFPNEELRGYMWEHLSSVLIGTNDNQTFNIYTGSGANGKSKLVELMGKALGDYKATVPITLITQTRNTIGSTSPEIVQLMGVRYACMQEPSKGDKINEGIMKEITGGDPLVGRALFKDSVTFIPQFKLVVCTNVLFEIKTNDDGTWRRIRVCDFMSKFNDDPYQDEIRFPKSNFPYQFKIDRQLDRKFNIWAPILASILVDLAFKKEGKVKDVSIVTAVSDKYRNSQDYLSEFAKEKILRKRDTKMKKTELLEEFKNWYISNYGRNNLPNGKEITDYCDKMFGKCYRGRWMNVSIVYDEDDSDNEVVEDVPIE
tara:strand:- start:52 stop:2916 length:2865 start_codon:yes stop_codon:yes gene_type:complete